MLLAQQGSCSVQSASVSLFATKMFVFAQFAGCGVANQENVGLT